MVVDKEQKTTAVTDASVSADNNFRSKEHEETEKNQRLKEHLGQTKSEVVSLVTGAVTPTGRVDPANYFHGFLCNKSRQYQTEVWRHSNI